MKKIFNCGLFSILLFILLGMFSTVVFANNLDGEDISNRLICYDVATGTEECYDLDEIQPQFYNEIVGCEAQEATELVEDHKLSEQELADIKEADKNTMERDGIDSELLDEGIEPYASGNRFLVPNANLKEFPYYTVA